MLILKGHSKSDGPRAGPKEKPDPKSTLTHSFYSLSKTTPLP